MRLGAPAAALALAVLLPLTALGGQQPASPDSDPFADLVAASEATGAIVVLVGNGAIRFRSYGETYPGSASRPTSDSLIRLCSISKILTTDLLVKLIDANLVHLSDSLQSFAPRGAHVPRQTVHGPARRAITLGDLATHTSGLPREIGSAPPNTPHFTFPDHDRRWHWLETERLRTSPGAAALYSNIGFDLLGDALESASGKSYARLFNERTARPLGLRNTTLTPTPQQCARLLLGARDEGPCTDTQASAGSSGMYSTAADMARLLQYLLGAPGLPRQDPAALAIALLPAQLTSTIGLDHAGRPTGIGLGWVRLGPPGTPSAILEKTGGGAGFLTYIALHPSTGTGIFVAVTEGSKPMHLSPFHEANNLLAATAGVPPLPDEPPPPKPRRHPRPTARRHASRGSR